MDEEVGVVMGVECDEVLVEDLMERVMESWVKGVWEWIKEEVRGWGGEGMNSEVKVRVVRVEVERGGCLVGERMLVFMEE